MIRKVVRRALRVLGYEIYRAERPYRPGSEDPHHPPPAVEPVWPLPRRSPGPSDDEIRREFARFQLWHYAFEFEGGLSFPARHNQPSPLSNVAERPRQRFRHFMPWLVRAEGGSLEGKRVLDIACNAGFWSIQCALLGAQVVGFDGREELIEQANLVKSIVGADRAEFRVLDFADMTPEALGGTFDVVLNLGLLYHLPEPVDALARTLAMATGHVLLDTAVYPSVEALVKLTWEEPFDVRNVIEAGVVAHPSQSAVDLILRHLGVAESLRIPMRGADLPADYLARCRASWLISV